MAGQLQNHQCRHTGVLPHATSISPSSSLAPHLQFATQLSVPPSNMKSLVVKKSTLWPSNRNLHPWFQSPPYQLIIIHTFTSTNLLYFKVLQSPLCNKCSSWRTPRQLSRSWTPPAPPWLFSLIPFLRGILFPGSIPLESPDKWSENYGQHPKWPFFTKVFSVENSLQSKPNIVGFGVEQKVFI